MKDYKEFQFGWLIFFIIIPLETFISYMHIHNLGDKPLGTAGYIIVSSILVLIYLLFYGLTTKVSSDKITVVFGIGFPRKTILMDQIKSVESVKTPWYYGWGIHLIPKGMLYNISGTCGVELKFYSSADVVRIGSKDPQQLKQEIVRRIK